MDIRVAIVALYYIKNKIFIFLRRKILWLDMRHDVEVTYNESCSKNNTLNCWNALKFIKLQRSNEINASVNVEKSEKINKMVYG